MFIIRYSILFYRKGFVYRQQFLREYALFGLQVDLLEQKQTKGVDLLKRDENGIGDSLILGLCGLGIGWGVYRRREVLRGTKVVNVLSLISSPKLQQNRGTFFTEMITLACSTCFSSGRSFHKVFKLSIL